MVIAANPVPTDNPSGSLIGYNNLLTASTTTEAEKALVPNTFERFRPASGALTVKFQMAALADIDYIAIAAHTLAGETLLISTATTIGGATTDVESISPSDNSPIMIEFDTRNVVEVIITSTLAAASEIGIVYAGQSMQMSRSLYGGHSPIGLSQQTEYQSSSSESGQFLGRTITRKGLETPFSYQYLDPDWYRETFQSFVEAARTKPFFIKWRPDYYADEVAFGYTTVDIKPMNMSGGSKLMSVSFNMRGHADL